jgi:hypothetical protein
MKQERGCLRIIRFVCLNEKASDGGRGVLERVASGSWHGFPDLEGLASENATYARPRGLDRTFQTLFALPEAAFSFKYPSTGPFRFLKFEYNARTARGESVRQPISLATPGSFRLIFTLFAQQSY